MKRSRVSTSLLLLFFTTAAFSAGQHPAAGTRTWENRIINAAMARNAAFTSVVPESAGIVITAWPQSEQTRVLDRIQAAGTAASHPWYSLLQGIIVRTANATEAQRHFVAALDAAQSDPGTTWLLFVEFDRYRLDEYAQKALSLLEKQMFTAGGSASEIISKQLIQFGQLRKVAGETDAAHHYFLWAHRFDPSEITSILQRANLASIQHPVIMVRTISEIFPVLGTSWRAQLEIFSSWYDFVRRVILLSVLIILTIFLIRYLPEALHPFTHRYPDKLPPTVRMLLVSGVFISLLAFGVIPFAWILMIVIWRLLSRSERWLVGIAALSIALSPIDASIRERLDRLRNPQGDMMQLSRALGEGSDPADAGQHGDAIQPDDKSGFARNLKTLVTLLKQGEYSSVVQQIDLLPGNDPVVTNIKGIALMLGGRVDSAADCLKTLLQEFPNDVTATFNLSRCSVTLNDASTGMELLKKAASLNPASVNAFITGNDRYFSADWPVLRMAMFPDYSPVEFWKRFFLQTPPSSQNWNDRWGLSFLGIPPLASLILFLCMFIGMIISPQFSNNRIKMRRIFQCKYCGRTACRSCSSGVLCNSCSDKTIHFKGSQTYGELIERIAVSATHKSGLRAALFNMVIPGSGSMLAGKGVPPAAVLGIIGSSVVYAWWHLLLSGESFAWMSPGEILTTISIPVLFHLSCIIFYLPAALRHLMPLIHSASSGERTTDGSQRHAA